MSKGLVLGFFDGVHKAHKAVIKSAFDFSDDVTLITFKETPAVYFGHEAEYILSRKNSVEKIKKLGVKEVVELDFSKIAGMNSEDYLKYLIDTYHPVSISTGFNHTFGRNKSGNSELLYANQKKYEYKYICVPPIKEDNEVVSSSLIKKYLREGNVEKANSILESNFTISGTVIHGAKLGRTIGFPTANIIYPKELVKLPFGAYKVVVNDRNAVMNWGMKPTVNNVVEPVAEVHILDFEGDLYGKYIGIDVLKQIRPEKKFDNLDELKIQIEKDIKSCSEL